jgi:hypothetical protein
MMETYFYVAVVTVCIMAAAYMVSRAVSVLCHTRLFGLWDRIPARRNKTIRRKIYDPTRELYRRVKEAEADALSDTGRIGILFNEIDVSRSGEGRQESASVQPDFNPKREVGNASSYRDRFLVNDGVCERVSTYLNRDAHEKIKRLLSSAAPGVSIVSYINNIVVHHLKQYQDEITELYRSGMDKPFN